MRGAHAPTASASPLEDDLPGVVKRMNRVSDFETACVEISRRVRAARDAPDPPHDALFAAVMRAGVVLRTRHAETSPGWHFGAALFAEAEETFRERPAGDVEKIATLARVARAAVDDAAAASEEENPKAPEENPRPTARRAFEGQLSGEVEREFDRPRVGNNGDNDGPTDVDAPLDPAQPDAEALVAMLRRAEATLAAEGEGSGGERVLARALAGATPAPPRARPYPPWPRERGLWTTRATWRRSALAPAGSAPSAATPSPSARASSPCRARTATCSTARASRSGSRGTTAVRCVEARCPCGSEGRRSTREEREGVLYIFLAGREGAYKRFV